jgi:hypothetical protein
VSLRQKERASASQSVRLRVITGADLSHPRDRTAACNPRVFVTPTWPARSAARHAAMPGGSAGALPYHALSPGASSDEGPENRAHVRIFSWFGLVLGALHTLGGSALGLLQVAISCIGLYATWSNTRSRLRCVAAFAAGWAIWAVFETCFLVLVLAALSATASDFVASLVASTTFPDVAPHVRSLFAAVQKDVGVFVVFSAFTAVLFDVC